MCTSEENGVASEAIVLQWPLQTALPELKAMGWCTDQCKMLLFCVKTIMKESHNFELAHLKKKKTRKKKKEER